MTIEPTQPQPEQGSAPDNGQVQSQGHRRRRRRRKNKSSQQAGAQGQPQQGQGQPQMQSPAPAQQAAAAKPHQIHQFTRPGPEEEKVLPEESPHQPLQPGNSIYGPPQGRRKGRQKGPRTFVGPMDHSYRVANGNVADGPPSTIPTCRAMATAAAIIPMPIRSRPRAIREDAPTRIFCFIEDLFFLAKIQETARKLGVKVEFVKGDKEAVARICDAPENGSLHYWSSISTT